MAMNWRDWVSTWLPEEQVSEFKGLLEQILSATPDPDNALAFDATGRNVRQPSLAARIPFG